MRVVIPEQATVTYLFPMDETRPKRGTRPLEIVTALAARYKFMEVPDLKKPYQQIVDGPFKFMGGLFDIGGESHVIKELSIYRDGVSSMANHSDTAEALLQDVLSWAKEQFGLRDVPAYKRVYVSQLIVDFDGEMERIFAPLSALRDLLRPLYLQHREVDATLNMKRLSFGVDPLKHIGGQYIADCYFERRVETPHEQNRYITEMPFPTDVCISVLEKLEALIKEN